ncbi:MAG: TolC family protein [Synergistaceae bacterium]|jgi:NodT family efflux transporter outer membrane factor (OMF) lipoprotein|nr:TolC family protein [Synergistaceae bacterium]
MKSEKRQIKTALAAIIMLLCAAVIVCPANAATSDDDAWEALLRKYDRKSSTSADEAAVISDDEAVRRGDWSDLVRKYENGYAAGEIPELSAEVLADWWDTFGDATLRDLIAEALKNNRDLRAARAKVLEARAALGISKAAALPQLDSAASWMNSKSSEHSVGQGVRTETTSLGLDASWEIDIFGGRKFADEAAEADLESSHAALHSAWVTLSSEVALNYLSLRTLQERLRIANHNLRLQEETLSMISSMYDAGLVDTLALNQSKYTVETTRASIPTLKSNIEAVMNTLAILSGRTPGSLESSLVSPRPLPKPDTALAGIPADAVRQRPDIRAAERALAAQISRKKSAERDLYPKFYLAGSIGLETLSGSSLFSGDSFGFSFGPRITLPIFNGGAIRKNIEVQSAREEQLLASYEGVVLKAVAEVRDALSAHYQEIERNKSLRAAIDAARMAYESAADRYRNGLTDFSNVINAEAALLSLEDQLAVSEGQMASGLVRIFKALGGGWAPLAEESKKLKTSGSARTRQGASSLDPVHNFSFTRRVKEKFIKGVKRQVPCGLGAPQGFHDVQA